MREAILVGKYLSKAWAKRYLDITMTRYARIWTFQRIQPRPSRNLITEFPDTPIARVQKLNE